MHVEFWFDPACPFCWMTSRWIREVAPERHLTITWRSISLLLKNGTQPDNPFHQRHVRTHGLLRVVEAVRAAGGEDEIDALYTQFGRRIHHDGDLTFAVAPILESLGLDPALAAAEQDESWDDVIRASMQDGLSLTGDDVGTPIIGIHTEGGRVGLFGPVLTQLPDEAGRVRLWDGFIAMATTPGFYELKRTRTGRPNPPPIERT